MLVKFVIFFAIVYCLPAIAGETAVPADQVGKYWHAVAENERVKAEFFAGLTSAQKKQMEDMQATSLALQAVRAQICKGQLSGKDQSPDLTCVIPDQKQ